MRVPPMPLPAVALCGSPLHASGENVAPGEIQAPTAQPRFQNCASCMSLIVSTAARCT